MGQSNQMGQASLTTYHAAAPEQMTVIERAKFNPVEKGKAGENDGEAER